MQAADFSRMHKSEVRSLINRYGFHFPIGQNVFFQPIIRDIFPCSHTFTVHMRQYIRGEYKCILYKDPVIHEIVSFI